MTVQDAFYCPACGAGLATIEEGRLITAGDPLYDDGDCLDWFAEEVALPDPPLFASAQYLKGQCHACSHPVYWLEINFAVLPFENMSWIEADNYIGSLCWACSDYRMEEAEEDLPWGWFSAKMRLDHQRGQHHLIGPFSIAATALSSPDGYGLYRLFRNLLARYWGPLLSCADQLKDEALPSVSDIVPVARAGRQP
ncbi:MAG: hypothetical protein ABIW82_16795 [Dokdonella sp.]